MVVHSGQVEPLKADAGYSVLNLLRPQLCGLLLLLYEPGERSWGKVGSSLGSLRGQAWYQ